MTSLCLTKVSFLSSFSLQPQLAKDLLHPSPEEEKRRHKKKRLVQSPNSYFMDVKCPGTVMMSTHVTVNVIPPGRGK